MRRAVITGSFDPVTSGHLDLIRRAADIFDEVYAVILFNAEKKSGMFSPEDRLKLLKCAISELGENVHADMFSGLTSDYIHSVGAKSSFIEVMSRTSFLSFFMKEISFLYYTKFNATFFSKRYAAPSRVRFL